VGQDVVSAKSVRAVEVDIGAPPSAPVLGVFTMRMSISIGSTLDPFDVGQDSRALALSEGYSSPSIPIFFPCIPCSLILRAKSGNRSTVLPWTTLPSFGTILLFEIE